MTGVHIATLSVPTFPGGGLEIPYADIRGSADGPVLTVLAGVHGAEYTSIAAVREFIREVDPENVSGRIVAVPIANLPGFWARSPFVVPVDGKNLNRSFPGDPAGSGTEVLAHQLTEAFIRGADYLVDLHAGDIPEALEPFTIYDEGGVEKASRDLALAYGFGHVVRQPAGRRTVAGSTSSAAADLGIPAIVAEAGQNGLVERRSIELHLAGLRNVARFVGVLPGSVVPPGRTQEHNGWNWLRSPVAGWWEPAVGVGTAVSAGDLLGTMSELVGGVAAEIHAPEEGVVLFLTTSPAIAADGLLLGLART